MVNFTVPITENIIPQQACEFYHGYYAMSLDMGALIFKIGILFAVLELLHILFKHGFELLKDKYLSH